MPRAWRPWNEIEWARLHPQSVRNIIVLNMNYIGDVLFTTPALAALQRGYPDAAITVVVGERAKDVVAVNPNVSECLVRPRTNSDRWRMLRQLRARRYQLAVSFSARCVELAAWGVVLGCRSRFGFNRPDTRWFLNGRVEMDETRHWVDDYLKLALAAGGQDAGNLPSVFLAPEEKAWAVEYLREAGLEPGAPVLGVQMGATYASKCWRPERWEQLARLAASERGMRVIAFGGPADRALGDGLAAAVPGTINLAGKLSLRQFMAAANCCSAFVGGDSGPTHIAAALGLRTVALFGFTNPVRTGTRGRHVRILCATNDFAGVDLGRQEVPYQLLDPITPDEVWDAACLLSER